MSDKTPVQADGGDDRAKPKPDLANDKLGSGESDGGAYPNPHSGDEADADEPSHGGQSHIDYSGPDNPNATTGGD